MPFTNQRRSDFAKLGGPVRTPAGYLMADGFLTRAGVFEYRDSKGTVTRELRHPDDVFHADSLASLKLVPVTNLHPSEGVNAHTASKHQRGAVGENIVREGDHVSAKVAITDAALIKEVEAGRQELSCGYSCDVTDESGTFNGEKYDSRQTNIRYDHLAVVPTGRAGRSVRLRMDGAHQLNGEQDATEDEPMTTKKITVGGKEIEVSEIAALVVEQELSKLHAEIEGAKKDAADAKALADTAKGKADAAESALDVEKKSHKDAIDPVAMNKRIQERVALEKIAAKAGVEVKADHDDAAIKRAVVAKIQPETKLDGMADAYVDGAFGFVAAALSKTVDNQSALERALTPTGAPHKDAAEESTKKMIDANKNATADFRKANGR